MANALLKLGRARTKLPSQVLGLNPGDSLRKNIKFCMYMGQTGANFTDLHRQDRYTVVGSTATWDYRIGPRGRHLFLNPAGSSVYGRILLGQPKDLEFSGADQFTILSGFVRTEDQPAGWGRIVCRTNGSTGDDWGLILANDAGGGYARFRINGINLNGSTVLTNGKMYHSACTYKQGDRKLYLNGKIDASDTYSGTLANDQDIGIGYNPGSNGDRAFSGEIYYVVILDRALTGAEIKAFHQNPYRILNQQSYFLPLEYTVGGTTYFQSIAGSSTSTGALVKQTNKIVSGSTTGTGALSSQAILTALVTGSITAVGAIRKGIKKAVTGSLTTSGAIAKKTSRLITSSITSAGSLIKKTFRILAGSTTATGEPNPSFLSFQSIAGSITATGVVAGVIVILKTARSSASMAVTAMKRIMRRK